MFSGILTVLAFVLAPIAYLHIGYWLGGVSLKTWIAKDNTSLRSFLLFPRSRAIGCVGEKEKNILSSMDYLDETAPRWSGENASSPGSGLYQLCMMMLWPLKFLLNLPAYVLYGVIEAVRHSHTRRQVRVQEDSLVPTSKDDLHTLFERRRAVAEQIAQLDAKKDAIDEELRERKATIDAEFETEASVDAEVRELLEERVDKQH